MLRMEQQEARAGKRHEVAMERMETRHAREVQIELEKDRVELEGELRAQTRQVRQTAAELVKVQEERSALRQQLELVRTDTSDLLKKMGRDRRHHDVAQQTLMEKCQNLDGLVRRREKQDEGKKRLHKEAMGRLDALSEALELEKKALAKQEGQWRWKCAKQERQLGVEKEALRVSKFGVDHARQTLSRKKLNMAKRDHTLTAKANAVRKDRAKVHAEREVALPYYCFCFDSFPCLVCSGCL